MSIFLLPFQVEFNDLIWKWKFLQSRFFLTFLLVEIHVSAQEHYVSNQSYVLLGIVIPEISSTEIYEKSLVHFTVQSGIEIL